MSSMRFVAADARTFVHTTQARKCEHNAPTGNDNNVLRLPVAVDAACAGP